jgi:hypothetical protein
MGDKLKYAQSLPGYGFGGANGSTGLLGFSIYFTSYNGDIDTTTLVDLIDLNVPLLVGSHFPQYLNRPYQTGDVFVDIGGKVFQIDLSLPSRYSYTGYILSSKNLFVNANIPGMLGAEERWSNQYPFNIIDTVNANTLTSSYYTDYPDSIYGIDSKQFARIEYSNKTEAGGRNVFSLYIGAAADASDNYALGLIRDIASNTFRFGNLDDANDLRDVALNFDVKSLKVNKLPFTRNSVDGTILSNTEIDTKNLIWPLFKYDPASFTYDSPLSTYAHIYWDKRDFLNTNDLGIVNSIPATLYFYQKTNASYNGKDFNFLDDSSMREFSFPNIDVSGIIRISGLPSGFKFGAHIAFDDKGWERCSKILSINPGTDPVHLMIHNPAPICFPNTVDLTNPAITAGSTPGGITLSYWSDYPPTTPLLNPTAVGINSSTYTIQATDGISIDASTVLVIVHFVTAGISVLPVGPFCSGTSVTFTGTGGTNYNFRVDNISVQNGASSTYTTTTLTSGQVVDVVVTDAITGCSATSAGIINTVSPSPTVVITNPTPVCYPNTVDLTAPAVTAGSTAGLSYSYWYDALATSGIPNPTAVTSGTYYIKGDTGTGCFRIQPVVAVQNALPVFSVGNNGPVCVGSPLSLTGPAGMVTYSWTGPLGFVASTQNPLVSAAATLGMAGVYTLTASDIHGCSNIATTTPVVNSIPSIISTMDSSKCGMGTVTLGATASAGTINWYNAPTGGSSLGTGTSFTTPILSSTTTYYVDTTNNGCTSPRSAVVATINSVPTVNITNPAPVELPATVNLTAPAVTAGSTPGLTFTYWHDSGATSPVADPVHAAAGTYYIKGTVPGTGCYSIHSVLAVQTFTPVIGFDDLGNINVTNLGGKTITLDISLNAHAYVSMISGGSGRSCYASIGCGAGSATASCSTSTDCQDVQTDHVIIPGVTSGSVISIVYDISNIECGYEYDVGGDCTATMSAFVTNGGGGVAINYNQFQAYSNCSGIVTQKGNA